MFTLIVPEIVKSKMKAKEAKITPELLEINQTPLVITKLSEFGLKFPFDTPVKIPIELYEYHKLEVEKQFHSTQPNSVKDAIAIARAAHDYYQKSGKSNKFPYHANKPSQLSIITWLLVLIVLLLLILTTKSKAQDNNIKLEIQQSGTRQRLFAAGMARLNCGSGLTCSWNAVNARVDVTVSSSTIPISGTSGQVLYNNSGVIAGASGFIWQSTTPNVAITAQGAAIVPFQLKAASSQTADLLDIRDSSNNLLTAFNKNGFLGIGANAGTTNETYIDIDKSNLAASSSQTGFKISIGNTNNNTTKAIDLVAYGQSSGTTGVVTGLEGRAENSSGTTTTLTALNFVNVVANAATTSTSINVVNSTTEGTTTNAIGIKSAITNQNVITTAYGINLSSWSNSGTVTTSYGIYADSSIDIGTTKYFIYSTSASPSVLGGSLQLGSVTFANLGTPANGTLFYCSNCTKATPCASGGSGALAKRINSAWDCN